MYFQDHKSPNIVIKSIIEITKLNEKATYKKLHVVATDMGVIFVNVYEYSPWREVNIFVREYEE